MIIHSFIHSGDLYSSSSRHYYSDGSDGLEKGMMLAYRDGRGRRGRPRRRWMDEIHEVIGMKLAELRDMTKKRKQ